MSLAIWNGFRVTKIKRTCSFVIYSTFSNSQAGKSRQIEALLCVLSMHVLKIVNSFTK